MVDSMITGEMKSAIGVESEPSIFEIDKEAIRRWAEAIGDPNPLYHDEEYARKLGYRSIIAPPAFFPFYSYPLVQGKLNKPLEVPLQRRVAGGDGGTLFSYFQAGDKVSQTRKIVDIVEKDGKLGKMIIVTSEDTMRNQSGEIIAISNHIEIFY